MIDYPTNSAPFTEGDWQYFYQNSGTQNHSVLMRRRGNDEPTVFLDPNTFSNDATVSLAGIAFSKNGQYAAYATSDAGSDWRTIHVIDTETLAPLNAPLQHVKFSGLSWQGDQGSITRATRRLKAVRSALGLINTCSFFTRWATTNRKIASSSVLAQASSGAMSQAELARMGSSSRSRARKQPQAMI